MNIGDIYLRKKPLRTRRGYYEVLSITLTHVYLRSLDTGFSHNFPISHLDKEYVKLTSSE